MKKLLLTLTAIIATTAAAQTTPIMPLSFDLLPFGTVQMGDGGYLVPNYLGSGITVMVYSPRPIAIGNMQQTVAAQAAYAGMMQNLARGGEAMQAPQVTQGPPAVQPAQQSVTFTATSASAATTAPAAVTPIKVAAAVPATIIQTVPPAAPAQITAPPAPVAVTPSTPAPTITVAPTPRPLIPAVLPAGTKGKFSGRSKSGGYEISYSVVNTTASTTYTLDPSTLSLTQAGRKLAGRLDRRDTSGTPNLLPPSGGEYGVLSLTPMDASPITLTWEILDDQGNHHPFTQTFNPPASTLGTLK